MAGEAEVKTGEDTQVSEVQDMVADFLPTEPDGADGAGDGEKVDGPKEGEEGAEADTSTDTSPAEPSGDIKALMEKIKALETQMAEATKPKEDKPKEDQPLMTKYFNKPEEFEAAFEKPEAMELVLNKVKADAKQETVDAVVKTIPVLVSNLVKTQVTVMRTVDNFFSKNPDLTNKRQFVSTVANELMGKNPGWSLKKLFDEELGKEVNKRLGVKPGAGKPSGPGQPPKPTASRKPAGKTEPELAPLQKEIMDLIS